MIKKALVHTDTERAQSPQGSANAEPLAARSARARLGSYTIIDRQDWVRYFYEISVKSNFNVINHQILYECKQQGLGGKI
jgi:hypothetical protein